MFDLAKQRKANATTRKRIIDGEIIRPKTCSRCPSEKHIIAHHPNYDKPKYIIWLCRKCHLKEHEEDAKQERKRRKELLKKRLGNVGHLVKTG